MKIGEISAYRKKFDNKRRSEWKKKTIRWHTPRGNDPINFTMLPNLLNVIGQNHEHFPIIPNIDWASNIFEVIERSQRHYAFRPDLQDGIWRG